MKALAKSFSVFVVLFLFVATAFQAFGFLPSTSIYEPFATVGGGSAYAVGDTLTNQICASGAGVWTNANTTYSAGGGANTNYPKVFSGNLSKSGMPTSTGNSVQFGGVSGQTGGGASRFCISGGAQVTGGTTVYYSLLMQCRDLKNINTGTGAFIAGLNNSTNVLNAGQPTVVMGRLMIKTNSAAADSYFIGVGKEGTAANWAFSGTSFGTNDVVHIVVSHTLIGAVVGTDDVSKMWINPSQATFGSASEPAADLTSSTGADPATGIGSFILFNRAGTPTNTVMDEMRFGTNWASVTPGAAPSITSQPASVTNTAGATAIFTATVSGTANLNYQWRKNGSNLSDTGNVTGSASASLTLTSVSGTDEADYTLVVTNNFGSITSSITSFVLLTAPAITSQPAARTNDATTTATFNVVASGFFKLYQWRSNGVDLANGGDVSGATSDTLTLANVLNASEATYTVQVTNDAGGVLSDGASTLNVNDPVITAQPVSQTKSTGESVIFNVTAVGTAPSYQWKKNNSNLSDDAKYSGSTTASLTVSSLVSGDAGNYTVAVTGPDGVVNSSTGILTMASAPIFTLQPVSQTVGAGSNAVFNATVTGALPITYQWKKDGTNLADNVNVSGSGTNSLTISGISQDYAGVYTLSVTNGDGDASSEPATLTVIDPPTITVQPTDAAVMPTSNATFSVTATGISPLIYQWKKDGSNLSDVGVISGATTALLSLSSVSIANAGNYAVVITNLAGSVTSSPNAVLTVGPAITVQPTNRTVGIGTNATFTVTATGSSTLGYQWRTNGIDLVNGGNIAGATTTTLTVLSAQHTDEGINYSVVVTNAVGSATSTDATLTVIDPPVITLQPTNQTPNHLSDITLVVSATGTGPLSYQWRRNTVNLTNGNPANVSGATTSTLSLSGVNTNNSGNYVVVITNAIGSVTSSIAGIAVIYPLPYSDAFNYTAGENLEGQITPEGLHWDTAGTATGNRITITNVNLSVSDFPSSGKSIQIIGGTAGPAARFSFPSSNNITTGTIYYSFLYKAEDLSNLNATGGFSGGFGNSTGPQGTVPGVYGTRFYHRAATSGGTNGYNIGISKSADSSTVWDLRLFTSNETVLVVGGYTFNPSTADDVAEMWINPDPTTFGAASAPAASITGNTANADLVAVASCQFRSLTGNAQPSKSIMDELRVSRNWAEVVPASPPVVTVPPTSQTVNAGTDAIFNVTVTGTPNLSYQWQKDGGNISGATSATLTLTAVIKGNDAGDYRVIITNFAGSVTSSIATLTVNEPIINSQPVSVTNGAGTDAMFTISASGTALTYQWKKDGANIAGATSATLTLTSVNATDEAGYSVGITNSFTEGTNSASATLTVVGPPVIVTQPDSTNVLQGGNATFSVTASGLGLSYQWKYGGSDIIGATDSSYTVVNVQSDDDDFTYSVTITNLAGSTNSDPASLTFTEDLDLPTVKITTPASKKGTNQAMINVTGQAKDKKGIGSGIVTSVVVVHNAGVPGGTTNAASLLEFGSSATEGKFNFSSPITLTAGTNTLLVYATDLAGNTSAVSTATSYFFFYDVTNNLTLEIGGTGSVKGAITTYSTTTVIPNYYKVGRPYAFDAFVGAGTNYVFTNWATSPTNIGYAVTNWVQKNKLLFVMQPEMTIHAGFLANPFTPVAGIYNGLFSEPTNAGGVRHESAGFVSVKVGAKSGYSGYLVFDGDPKVTFSGKFTASGDVTRDVRRDLKFGKAPVRVSLALDWSTSSGEITGTVTNGTWTSELLANLAKFDAKALPPVLDSTNFMGRYTMQIPRGAGSPASAPGGVGYGTITNNAAGIITLAGKLGDGGPKQAIQQKVNIGRNGDWPLYVGLYPSTVTISNALTLNLPVLNKSYYHGALMGWVKFTSNNAALPVQTNGLTGDVIWIKTAIDTNVYALKVPTNAVYYTNGFSNEISLVTSPYVPPGLNSLPIELAGGEVVVSDGDLAEPITNAATAILTNKIFLAPLTTNSLAIVTTNKMAITIAKKDGSFKGSYLRPGDALKAEFFGALLQNTTNAQGHFLGATNTSGHVIFNGP